LPGVRIELWSSNNGSETGGASLWNSDLLHATTTNSAGHYLFDEVLAGAYLVIEIDPQGYESSTPNQVSVVVLPGQSVEASFGDQPIGWTMLLPLVLH